MKAKILPFIAATLLKILRLTYRYQLIFPDKETENKFKTYLQNPVKYGDNFLLAFFHQDELALIPYFKHKNFSVLVSLSKDGELMTKMSEKLGYSPVRGSSSRGAVAGLIAAIKKVKEGYHFAIAVDGPRGPIFKVKDGICAISKKTDRPILPVRAIIENQFIFEKSWNKAKFPKPFTRISLFFAPFAIYEKEQLEETLLNLYPTNPKSN